MLYIDSIWEYIVNFLELALFIIFIHKKLRIRANYKHQAVLMFLFVSFQFAVLCTLNKMGISSYSTLMSSCVLDKPKVARLALLNSISDFSPRIS